MKSGINEASGNNFILLDLPWINTEEQTRTCALPESRLKYTLFYVNISHVYLFLCLTDILFFILSKQPASIYGNFAWPNVGRNIPSKKRSVSNGLRSDRNHCVFHLLLHHQTQSFKALIFLCCAKGLEDFPY